MEHGEVVLIWEEPPAFGGGSGKWVRALAPLLERPGAWARVFAARDAQVAGSAVRNLRAGRVHIPPGKFEFRWCHVDGVACVYARYIGPEDESSTET